MPYRELARRAHYSSTTLSDAAGGRRLPSLAVTLAYVRACDGDPSEWTDRWRQLANGTVVTGARGPADAEAACPYVGLTAFQVEDADRFFGRDALTTELLGQVGERRAVMISGASGAGKSSLLRAGLLARMRSGDGALPRALPWSSVLLHPGANPVHECARRLAAVTGQPAQELYRELTASPDGLDRAIRRALAGRPNDVELLLVVDQFEETFTRCRDRKLADLFVETLLTAVRAPGSRTRLLLAVRSDFAAHCARYPALLRAVGDAPLHVGPMSTEELRQAVSRPMVATGGTVEGALLARVVADATGQAAVLPLVSQALRETWHRRRGTTLTLSGYEAVGGLQHALARTAEAVYGELTAKGRRSARGVLIHLVALGEEAANGRRRVRRVDLPGQPMPGSDQDRDAEPVLELLARARLVTLDAETVELTHGALADAWPRFRRWLERDHADLCHHHRIAADASRWEQSRRDPALLYRGRHLVEARQWAARWATQLPVGVGVSTFLNAGSRRAARVGRLRVVTTALLTAFAVLACAAATVALQQRSTARAERERAIAEQTMIDAEHLRGTDVSLAALLSAAAYRIRPTPNAYTDLLGTENVPLATVLASGLHSVRALAYRPDGRMVATAGGDDVLRLWDVGDQAVHRAAASVPTGLGGVAALAFSPDGSTLAVGGQRGLRLWDVSEPARPKARPTPPGGGDTPTRSVVFSPDGHTLAAAGAQVRLWDVRQPDRPNPLPALTGGQGGPLAGVAFGPNGDTVAAAGADGALRLWRLGGRPQLLVVATPPLTPAPRLHAVAYSPDGRLVATVGEDHEVRLWNVTDPTRPAPGGDGLPDPTVTGYAVAFSQDGHTLATAGTDHSIRLWNITDAGAPVSLGPPLTGHSQTVYALAFGPDGRHLASSGQDGTVQLWSLPETRLVGHIGPVRAAALSPDGRTLATGETDESVRLWDVTRPHRPVSLGPPLTGHGSCVGIVAFSPDGHTLATAGTDGSIWLWNVSDPSHPRTWSPPLRGHTDIVRFVAFSPDGRTLATASADRTVRLWDIADPAHPAPGPVLLGHTDEVYSVAFSPDRRTLASVSLDGSLRLWDVSDPARATALGPPVYTHNGGSFDVAFDPAGRHVATAGMDYTVRLWDVSDRRAPTAAGPPLRGHTGIAYMVAFSPDGRTLASSGADQTIRLWDVSDPAHSAPSGRPIADNTGVIGQLAYSADGGMLVSATEDRTVELLSLNPEQAIRRICAATAGSLTPDQWRQYIPDLPYQSPCSGAPASHDHPG